jgi:hypothetical protein
MDIQGTIEDPANLKINIVDFTLFDIGTGAYTEFEVTPEIIMPLYAKHPEYITMKYGCLHSHNSMPVFFSGTDTSTLLEQAFVHNFFVSLIINNNFDKIAKISYQGTRTTLQRYYNRIKQIMIPFTRDVVEEVVYVIDCDVEYEIPVTRDLELLEQIAIIEILEEEKNKKKKATIYESTNSRVGKPFWEDDHSWDNVQTKKPSHGFKLKGKNKQLPIFSQEEIEDNRSGFSTKCESFVKQLMLVDYSGDETALLTLDDVRNSRELWYSQVPLNDYLEEVTEWCDTLLYRTFQKEIEANFFEKSKLQKLRIMIFSECQKFLDVKVLVEQKIFEIIDAELRTIEDERQERGVI